MTMVKLARGEKIKVGIGIAIIVAVLAFAASPIFCGGWSSADMLSSMVRFGTGAANGASRGGGSHVLDEDLVQTERFAPADVTCLEIDWSAGDIRLERGASEDIVVTETIDAGSYRAEPRQASIELLGDTLAIDDNLTDEGLTIGGNIPDDLDKHLVVTLPASWDARLDAVEVDTLDASITADSLTCRDFTLSAMDPTVTVDGLDAARVAFDMMDGEVKVSGTIAESVDASYMDGSYSFAFANAALPVMTFSGMDGDVALAVPDGAGLTLSVGAMSHEVDGARAGELIRTGDGVYVLGDGAARIDVSAMDGSVTIS